MGVVFASWIWDILLAFLVTVLYSYLSFHLHGKHYWRRRNIPHLQPLYLVGNTWRSSFMQSLAESFQKIYLDNKDKGLLGVWFFRRPVLFVNDVTLAKNMLVKDFHYFHDRGIKIDEKLEPLTAHLFNLNGSKWKTLRAKLTPTFTSGKLKMMFPTVVECGEKLQEFLKRPAENNEAIEVKDILSRFTTDIISSCAFGIVSNSLENPECDFRKYGKKIFMPRISNVLLRLIQNFNIAVLHKLFPIRQIPKDVSDFFMNLVRETIDVREKNSTRRKDFMDLLIQLKNQECEEIKTRDTNEKEFTFEVLAAQAFNFFFAGFETLSTTMQFALYELALNPPLQRKLQTEIDAVLAKHDNQLTYESVHEMDFLDRVVNETLRKYPPIPALFRKCVNDYPMPSMRTTIDKGTTVVFPIYGIHNDPRYFPKPDNFDPERFSPEETAKRDSFQHIPFGEGPRICIATRFASLQVKTGLVFVLSKYDVQITEETPIPLKMEVKSFFLTPASGLYLKISNRRV